MGVDATTDPKRSLNPAPRAPLVEAALFLAVGGSATLLNMIFYVGLVQLAGIKPTYAAAFSFFLVVPFHFLSYARIVFPPDRVDVALLVRYAMALTLSFALNVGLVGLYWGLLGAEPIPAQLLGLIPAILANYLTFKFFVFRAQMIRLPQLNATTVLTLATIAISGLTAYAAIAAMLLAAGPAPVPEVAATLRAQALRSLLDTGPEWTHLLPETIIKANAVLFGSAPSIIAILTTGLFGLTGLILAYASDQPLAANAGTPAQRIAAGLTVLAGVLVLQIAVADTLPSDAIAPAIIVLGATLAALAAGGLIGRLTQPVSIVIFCAAAIIATLSGPQGAIVWLLAPIGLVMARNGATPGTAPIYNASAMLAAFAIAAGLADGTTAFLPLLLATLIAAANPILHAMTTAGYLPRDAAAIATFCMALAMSALAYGAAASS